MWYLIHALLLLALSFPPLAHSQRIGPGVKIGPGVRSGPTITILPIVTIVATTPNAAESGATGAFTVSRSGSVITPLVVNLAIGGTATVATDYQAIGSTVLLDVGASSAVVAVLPVNDATVEGSETVVVTVTPHASGAYTIGAQSSATVTIADDGNIGLPTVTVVATDASAAESGGTGMVTFSRTGSTTGSLAITYTIDGTATNGVDYSTLGTSTSFAPGASTVTVTVQPINDVLNEGAETVVFTLAANAAYTVGAPSAATVTIADDGSNPGLAAFTIRTDAPNNIGIDTYGFARAHVTTRRKWVEFFGNSHNSYGNNGVYQFDFDAGTWSSLWASDPSNGGLQNRDNFSSFYIPRLNEIWVWGGSGLENYCPATPASASGSTITYTGDYRSYFVVGKTFDVDIGTCVQQGRTHTGETTMTVATSTFAAGTTTVTTTAALPSMTGKMPYSALRAGRFNLTSNTWTAVSPDHSTAFGAVLDYSAVTDLISHETQAAAWNEAYDVGIVFGGSSTADQLIFERKTGGPERYKVTSFTGTRPPFRSQSENLMVAFEDGFYLVGGTGGGAPTVDRKDAWYFHIPTRTWSQLPDHPTAIGYYQSCLTVDTRRRKLVLFNGQDRVNFDPGTGQYPNKPVLFEYDLETGTWSDLTSSTQTAQLAQAPARSNSTCTYDPVTRAHYYRGGNFTNPDGTANISGQYYNKHFVTYDPGAPNFTLAANTWAGIIAPDEGLAPCPKWGGCKHTNMTEDTSTGKMFLGGGDYTAPGGSGSYRNEWWSFNFGTLAWTLEYPYSGYAGDDMPCRPDEIVVTYDRKRKRVWALPGTLLPETTLGTTCIAGSGGALGTFAPIALNPATQRFDAPGTYHGLGGSNAQQNRFGSYDPVTDTIIGFGGTGWNTFIYAVATDTWTVFPITAATTGQPLTNLFLYAEGSAIDVAGRKIYTSDPLSGAIYAYDIDARTVAYVTAQPARSGDDGNWHDPAQHRQDFSRYAWDANARVLYYLRQTGGSLTGQADDEIHFSRVQEQPTSGQDGWSTLYTYNPQTDAWTTAPTTTATGTRTRGNTLQFSARYNLVFKVGWEPTNSTDGQSPQAIPESLHNQHHMYRFLGK